MVCNITHIVRMENKSVPRRTGRVQSVGFLFVGNAKLFRGIYGIHVEIVHIVVWARYVFASSGAVHVVFLHTYFLIHVQCGTYAIQVLLKGIRTIDMAQYIGHARLGIIGMCFWLCIIPCAPGATSDFGVILRVQAFHRRCINAFVVYHFKQFVCFRPS